MTLASAESKSASSVKVATASSAGLAGFFGNLFGPRSEEQKAETRSAQPAQAAQSKPAATAAKPSQAAAVASVRPKPEPQPAEKNPNGNGAAAKPRSSPPQEAARSEPEVKAASTGSLLTGAAPTMPSGGFEGRFGAWR
jgi:hypothetical protein